MLVQSKKLDVRYAIESTDRTDVSTTRKYPLGLEITIVDQYTNFSNTYIYLQQVFNNATAYQVQDVFAGFGTFSNIATGTTVRPVIPQQPVPNQSYAFYQVGGVATAFVEETHAESITPGSYLKLVATANGFRNTAGNAKEKSVCAISLGNLDPGTDGNITVQLYNRYAITD